MTPQKPRKPPKGDGWHPALWNSQIKLMLIDSLMVSAVEVQPDGTFKLTIRPKEQK